MGISFIDRQHAGKPSLPSVSDRGARHDLDGSGSIETDEMEAMLTGYMSLATEAMLIEMGHLAIPISDGSYRDRHHRVNDYSTRFIGQPQSYIAMHINADSPAGDYGAVFFHPGSSQGKMLASYIADALRDTCDELDRVLALPATPSDWPGPYATIKGVGRPIAICFEPCFINQPLHAPLLEMQGLRRMGAALAEGINIWCKTS